jgi:putative transposase
VYVDNWVSQVSQVLHEGVIYRHIILTVPAMFRTTFYQNAAVMLRAFMRCGGQCLDDFYSTVRGKALRGGYITVLHTHGRNGQYHPHLHLLATSGGYDAQGARWEHLQYLPYELLRRKWQWHLLRMVRQTLKSEAINQLVDLCFRQYPNGLVTNVQKGAVPSQYQSVARYVAKYVVSPPIAVRRLDCYDGKRVTYHYRSHRTERVEHETVDVDTFIGRMVQHTMPKGFKRIRYSGVQATKTFAKVKVMIQAALAKMEGVVKGAVQIIARLTYRQRYEQSTGRDPLRCPYCQGEMEVWRIWHPTYGVIYDEGEVTKCGTYASTAPHAGP